MTEQEDVPAVHAACGRGDVPAILERLTDVDAR